MSWDPFVSPTFVLPSLHRRWFWGNSVICTYTPPLTPRRPYQACAQSWFGRQTPWGIGLLPSSRPTVCLLGSLSPGPSARPTNLGWLRPAPPHVILGLAQTS